MFSGNSMHVKYPCQVGLFVCKCNYFLDWASLLHLKQMEMVNLNRKTLILALLKISKLQLEILYVLSNCYLANKIGPIILYF